MIFRRLETGPLGRHVEELLTATYQTSVSLTWSQWMPGRSNICRFTVRKGPAELGNSLIVKRLPTAQVDLANSSSYPSPRYRFFNDWAGLQFLSEVVHGASLSPRLYAAQHATADRATDLIVMEDFKTERDVSSFLKGKEPRLAEEILLLWAGALGNLHASTVGKEALFKLIRDELAPRRPSWGWVPHWQRLPATYEKLVQTLPEDIKQTGFERFHWMHFVLHQTASVLSVPVSPTAAAELETVIQALCTPGPFLAYTHGDPCPGGNCLVMGKEVRLVDFENGDYRHALFDIVYARIGFPTCWESMLLPHSSILCIEQAYRAEFVKGCPEASDNRRFAQELVHACAYWTLMLCQFNAIAQFPTGDRYWKPYRMCQRILTRFERFAQTTIEFGYLESLGSLFAAMASTLRERWPAHAQLLPVYPALRRVTLGNCSTSREDDSL